MTVRKISTALLTLILCLSLGISAFAQSIPLKTDYVNDAANVLTQNTEEQVNAMSAQLSESCGLQLAVLTQRSVDGSMKDFTTAVFDHWELNSKSALLVLNIQEQSYYVLMGSVAQQNFTQTELNNMLLKHLEPYFAEENYDAGVIALCTHLRDELTELYYVEPDTDEAPVEEKKSSPFVEFLKGLVKFILIIAAMLALVAGFVYARSEYLKVRRIRHQRREEILTGRAPSSYVPAREEERAEPEPENKTEDSSPFPSYNFDEKFEVDMDRDLSTPEDPETKEFDLYRTYSSTKYDFETFSKRK